MGEEIKIVSTEIEVKSEDENIERKQNLRSEALKGQSNTRKMKERRKTRLLSVTALRLFSVFN